ncbi:S9 family peptidase [Aggregicoccus sp. 17bor-14]|uniref:S9 family peptidase n=1 Tax=Myxococcaceae TaxID=31 RepID=UPI00129C5FF8|nr:MULTISPECIES: S9 family peptidase [Myxococcaceae]MBF5042158.1 S9 family peptidase [Simulacricoccus sp. 17bor-14]MRI87935.1 S9 family peptidase [Aggregicoccus sp. 17bor-14]
MKRPSSLALAALLLPALALAAPPTAPAPKRPSRQYSIEQFMATTRVMGASFSPDEKSVLLSSNQTGVFNAYTVPSAGGKPTPLTRSKTDSTYAVSYFPKDGRILYTRDQGGNEENHLYVRELNGREKDLTPGKKLKADFRGWTGDDSAFFVVTNERDPRFFDLYRYDAKTYARTRVFENNQGFEVGDVSMDGKWVALDKPNTTADSDIHLYNVDTKETKHLSPHKGVASYTVSSFDPESRALYFLTNDGSEFTRVQRYVLATGAKEDVEKADWDVMYTVFSKHGKYRITAINQDARTVIRLYDAKTNQPIALPDLPEGDVTSVVVSPSEARMAFYASSDRSPSNLYVHDFASGKTTRLTDTLSKAIDPEDLVDAEVMRFKSFDQMQIPNILFKPMQASAQAKAPALVWVHGGPGGQTRKGYSPFIQYLVNHGYVVLGINNRGSSGYGKTFFTADDRKHGAEPLWDCVAAKKYLQSLPYVDAEKIGIIGGSYGGYMTLAALAFQPTEFKVGVDLFGVSNWLRTLESVPPYWESFRKALYEEIGDPKTDAERLRATSPLFHADKIQRPLLVLQGKNDPRVIKPESDEIVQAVKKNGVPVEYVVFPDEGHGFTKKKNEVRAYSTTLTFLDKYLKAEPPAARN